MSIYIHTANDRTPYTYLIGWSEQNKWYYGLRFAKNCHPSDLFSTYFTSSKVVKKFIEKYGNPDVIQIRKTFKNVELARLWEHKVLKRMKVVKDEKFLNKTDNYSISSDASCYYSKGKTYEEIYGYEKAQELKQSRKVSGMLGYQWTDEQRAARSKKMITKGTARGGNNPRAVPVTINGVYYGCKTEARESLGLNYWQLEKILKSQIK